MISNYPHNEFILRMAAAHSLRESLTNTATRTKLLRELGTDLMPAIIPATGDTFVSEICRTAKRYLDAGETHVLIPISTFRGVPVSNDFSNVGEGPLEVITLVATSRSMNETGDIASIDLELLHEHSTMGEVAETLDPSKVWDVRELLPELTELING